MNQGNNGNFVQIGAAWSKTSKDGKDFLSGSLTDKKGNVKVFVEIDGQVTQINRLMVFANENKQSKNQPDYRIITVLETTNE